MNKQRRKDLGRAIQGLEAAKTSLKVAQEIIGGAADEEQDAYDCMPESMQESDRGIDMEENAETLSDASSELEDMIDTLYEQIDAIQEVIDK